MWDRCAGLALAAVLVSSGVHASGQYVVQDADIADPRSCDMELWHSDFEDANFLNLACRGTAPLQLLGEVEMPRGSEREAYRLEGKALGRELATDGYGLGLFVAAGYDSDSRKWEEGEVFGMLTLEPVADRLLVHLNPGLVYSREDNRWSPFWGIGSELALFGPVELAAEVFGVDNDAPTLHGAVRFLLFDEQVELDIGYFEETESGGSGGFAAGVGFQAFRF